MQKYATARQLNSALLVVAGIVLLILSLTTEEPMIFDEFFMLSITILILLWFDDLPRTPKAFASSFFVIAGVFLFKPDSIRHIISLETVFTVVGLGLIFLGVTYFALSFGPD